MGAVRGSSQQTTDQLAASHDHRVTYRRPLSSPRMTGAMRLSQEALPFSRSPCLQRTHNVGSTFSRTTPPYARYHAYSIGRVTSIGDVLSSPYR